MSGTSNMNGFIGMPYQKRSYKLKKRKYFEDCVDGCVAMSRYSDGDLNSTGVRASRKNKAINYNLFNDIVDPKEMERTVNYMGFNAKTFPAQYRNYPLLNPNINLLCGEERKRMFYPMVTVQGDEATNEKQQTIKDTFDQLYVDLLMENIQDEKVLEQKLMKYDEWRNFSYKDMRERMGTQILYYLYNTLDLKEEFSRGFEDLLISAEEIYSIDIIGGEPILRKANPLNITTVRMGESWKIEDSDIIIEESYMPIGKVIDYYYDYLTSPQVSQLENGTTTTGRPKPGRLVSDVLENSPVSGMVLDTLFDDNYAYGGIGELPFDNEGNVKVTRCLWKGLKKVYVLTRIDEFGNEYKEVLPEQWQFDKELGENPEEYWINEWYEGTKIGNDIYTKLGTCEVQMRHADNIAIAYPPIVGTVYNVNSSKGRSLMDVGKDYQYLWNTFWYRTELAFARYKGKIGKLPLHEIPDWQDVQSALYFAEYTGWLITDKFNEGNRGAAKGKIAGSMSGSSDVIDLEMGNYITQHINMLNFIKQQVDELTGITPQRKGAIDNRETKGGVEIAVSQSSHTTEKWFSVHDNTRVRALRALLEAAKIAWSGKSFTREFVMDDGTKQMLDFDYDKFKEASYGVDVSNSSNDIQALQAMKGLGERFAQVEGGLTLLAETYRAKDMASLYRKFTKFENDRIQRQQEQIQAQQEQEQAIAQQMQQLEMEKIASEKEEKELDRMLKQYEIDQNNETKITLAEIDTYRFQQDLDQNNNGIPDPMEIAAQGLKEREADSKAYMNQTEQYRKDRELNVKKEMEQKKNDLEKRKLALEEKKIEAASKLQKQKDDAAMAREKLKAKTAIKNKVSGEK